MFVLLRAVRGIFGFLFAMQVVQVVEALIWMSKPEAAGVDAGKVAELLLIKVVVLAISGAVFFWLCTGINEIHMKKRGSLLPALGSKRWVL